MRLIDADAFEVVTYKGTETFSDCFDNGVLYMLNELDKTPTVDAVPVKHGCWKRVEVDGKDCFGNSSRIHLSSVCSVCGHGTLLDSPDYCPNCGAKMDGERKEND